MAEWKKIVVSGSNISQLNNDAGFLESVGAGIVSGSSQISFTGITDVPSGLVSGSSQVDYTGITNVPAGIVSGSSQITLGGDLSGTADSATVVAVQGVALTSGEATQLANIGSTTISSTQWGYLGVMDQNVRTTDTVTFGNATITTDLTVGGDLTVNGDLTYINTENTLVEDQFILLGSGSADETDIGIIFDGAGGVGTGTGTSFFYDGVTGRLSYATEVSHTATAVTPEAYIPLAFDVDGASHTPLDAAGNIKIESGEAFIYV